MVGPDPRQEGKVYAGAWIRWEDDMKRKALFV